VTAPEPIDPEPVILAALKAAPDAWDAEVRHTPDCSAHGTLAFHFWRVWQGQLLEVGIEVGADAPPKVMAATVRRVLLAKMQHERSKRAASGNGAGLTVVRSHLVVPE
jgi:hypothetical protein